ncbi:hypothetical protein FBEOM_902 [Fusarium beomiforme]|uniref:Uncharacterized protein n=1 Tax=Fusarium beomiforme TaxID=44412 RepID=A0A9P5E5V5_9HYPO|nr:hypothetical protein FBEOM_902 [Fusarium beomiforme]
MAASQIGDVSHQLVPADSITASYDKDAGLLILSASGKNVNLADEIEFHRLPFYGGLLFELHSLGRPAVHGGSSYEITDSFDIELPSIVFPSDTVIVNTENKQNWVVPIQYSETSQESAVNKEGEPGLPDEVEQLSVDESEKIIVPVDRAFTIRQSNYFEGQGGSISIDFDKSFSTLTDAQIEDGKIEWSFTAQKTGKTQVVVYVGQTDPPFMYRVPYEVEVLAPVEDSITHDAQAVLSVKSKGQGSDFAYDAESDGGDSENGDGMIGLALSWDGFINVGLSLIKKQYPNAKLLELDATPLTRKPVDDEWNLVSNRIVCSLGGKKTAIIQSTEWGEFGDVQTIDSPFLGDQLIPWPVTLDIHDAFTILREAGYKQGVNAVTLRQPFYPGDDQPFYIFSIGNEFIGVGIKDKKIHNLGVSEYNIQKA